MAMADSRPLARIQPTSPTVQLQGGRYAVLKFMIHSDPDEIEPFGASVAFVEELKGEA